METMQQTASPASVSTNGEGKSLPTTSTQPVLRPWLVAQSTNLTRHAAGLRDFERKEFGTGPESPTEGHILAVNRILRQHRVGLAKRVLRMNRLVRAALTNARPDLLTALLRHKYLSHEWVKHIERLWDFYSELFGQRQSRFGPWLLCADRIALDCYQVAYLGIGRAKSVPAPPPFCYMRTGFGPATYRRGSGSSNLGAN